MITSPHSQISTSITSAPVRALDQALPHATKPIAILVNPPTWSVPWFQAAKRRADGEAGPPVYALYAGGQRVEVQRVNDHTLELHLARGWFSTPFEAHVRNVSRSPFRVGDRIALGHLDVEVREVDATGAPKRASFKFERPLDDPELSFWYWDASKLAPWTPPTVGTKVQLPAARGL